jgi:hypothetical protein
LSVVPGNEPSGSIEHGNLSNGYTTGTPQAVLSSVELRILSVVSEFVKSGKILIEYDCGNVNRIKLAVIRLKYLL